MGNDILMTVDRGNTLAKVTVFDGDRIVLRRRFGMPYGDEIPELLSESGASGAVYCSVGSFDVRLVETMRPLVDDNLLVVTHSTPVPLTVRYATPETLGCDRVAAAVGASLLYPGERLMVVDAGTAITVDAIDVDEKGRGVYCGGRISPGLALRFDALHRHTAALPLLSPKAGYREVYGDSTETSILSGVQTGAADELVAAYMRYREKYGAERIVLTGGDAGTLAPALSDALADAGCDAAVLAREDDLMAIGLKGIYEYCLESQRADE